MAKVTVIGSGNVGASTALYISEKRIADVLLIDVVEGIAQGKALDAIEAGPLRKYDTWIDGGIDFSDMQDSDVVVVTAGKARTPGMSRGPGLIAEDLSEALPPVYRRLFAELERGALT